MKPSDASIVMLLVQSWWTLAIAGTILVIFTSLATVFFNEFFGGRKRVVQAVELINQVLRSWAEFAETQGIGGVPVGIEFESANPLFLKPEQAIVVQQIGRREDRYRVVTNKEFNRRKSAGGWRMQESYSFLQIEDSNQE